MSSGRRMSLRSRGTSRAGFTDDHPRATTTGPRVSRGRRAGPAGRREPPCPWAGATAPPTRPVGFQQAVVTAGSPSRCVVGPSVDDRGVFTPPTQGGSLLAGNGRFVRARRGGAGRPHRVPQNAPAKIRISPTTGQTTPVDLLAVTASPLCQVLAKRGCRCRRVDTSPYAAPERGAGTATGPPTDTRRAGKDQKRTLASAERAAVTRGSSEPITSKSSSSRSRAASRSSPAVRRTASTSRPKASST